MKKFLAVILAMLGVAAASIGLAEEAAMEAGTPLSLTSPSAILCEASTGRVIFEKNADERRPVGQRQQGHDHPADAGSD